MPIDPVPESLAAQQPAEESTATADGLGDGERLATTTDESATAPGAMMEAAWSLEADAGVADAMPKSGVEKLVVLEE